jgi:diaminopimelate decarboxylase
MKRLCKIETLMTGKKRKDLTDYEICLGQGVSHSFMRAMKGREKILPKTILEGHLNGILNKREALLESASLFGTPQYFFDEPSLSQSIAQFNAACSGSLTRYRLFYAMKSNSFSGICGRVVAEGMGLDVSSGFELSMALSTDCKEIIFSGPGKTDAELSLAVQNRQRVTLLMDSFGELNRLSEILKRKKDMRGALRAGIRIQNNHQGRWDKFGIPLNDLSNLMKKALSTAGVALRGIQFHTSWNLDPSQQVKMINEIGSYLKQNLSEDFQKSLTFLDIGGGYWPEQGEWLNPQNTLKGKLLHLLETEVGSTSKHYYRKASTLEHFAREIGRALSRQGFPLRDFEIWMEPGRWISSPSMHVLLSVIDKKNSRTVITDGGTNLLGWERPLSEFIPVVNLSRPALREQSFRIFGSLCTPDDVWGTSVFGDGIVPGDVLVIPHQGAYTYSLRQSFIKPRSKVIRYNGKSLEKVEAEETL